MHNDLRARDRVRDLMGSDLSVRVSSFCRTCVERMVLALGLADCTVLC